MHCNWVNLSKTTVLVFSLLFMDILSAFAQDSPTKDEMKEYIQVLEDKGRQDNGVIRLAGVLVDDQGRQLKDVTLLIRVGRLDALNPGEGSFTRIERVVTGSFSYECKNCSDVHIWFSKEGFHGDEIDYVFKREEHGRALEATSLRIQLDQFHNLVTLERLRGELAVGGGIAKVLPVATWPISNTISLDDLEKKAASEGASEIPSYIRLEAALEADGTVATVPNQRPGKSKSLMQPKSTFLDFSTANGGAVLYEAKTTEILRTLDLMREAPESGYVTRLLLDPARNEPYFFYCKLGNMYGKGRVNPPFISSRTNGPRAATLVEIWLNTDGGRSVESRSP